MTNRLRSLAAAQTIAVRGDVEANLRQHLQLIAAAAALRPQVLVFPELSLTGYELDLAAQLAFSETDERLAPLRKAAAAHGMIAIVGVPIRTGAGLCIGAFILGADGSLDHYEKRYLGAFSANDGPDGVVPPPEASVFCTGSRDPVLCFEANIGAVSICKDSLHSEHAQQAAQRNARSYFSSQFAIAPHLEFKIARLRQHAQRHGMAVAMANYSGITGGLRAGGASGIWSEQGEAILQLGATDCGVVCATESAPGRWRGATVQL
jgi:predicted amidohydrolase